MKKIIVLSLVLSVFFIGNTVFCQQKPDELGSKDIEAKDVRLANIRLLIPKATWGRWSPDGKKIMYTLFVKKENRYVPQIRIMTLDGKSQQIIAEGSMPAWSPDGAMICYIGPQWKDGYYIYRFSDGKRMKIYDRDVAGTRPIWNKNGKSVACIPTAGPAEYLDLETLRTFNFDQSMRKSLFRPGFDASPNFYIQNVGGDLLKLGNIAVISKREGTQYPLLQNAINAELSPDGTKLLFEWYAGFGKPKGDGIQIADIAKTDRPTADTFKLNVGLEHMADYYLKRGQFKDMQASIQGSKTLIGKKIYVFDKKINPLNNKVVGPEMSSEKGILRIDQLHQNSMTLKIVNLHPGKTIQSGDVVIIPDPPGWDLSQTGPWFVIE